MRTATTGSLVMLLLAGCASGPTAEELPAATALCEAPSFPQVQGGSHLLGAASPPVPYSSTPGTSGWHQSGQPPTGAHQHPLREPEIVLALEVGQVVVTYDADALDPDEAELLTEVAESGDIGLVVTPFKGDMGAPLVLNGWGVRQPCEALDEQALGRFVETFASRAPGTDS